MTPRLMPVVALAAGLLAGLGGCQNVKEQLGLTKQSPDEFRVLSRAPLSLPPDYNLRPPEPGAPRPQVGTPTQQARQAVFRASDRQQASLEPVAGDGRSRGELALLQQAGADEADPSIRQIVNEETSALQAASQSFIERLVFWRDAPPPGYVVDAEGESKRLQENAALGRPATDGATPTVERRRRSLLEGLL